METPSIPKDPVPLDKNFTPPVDNPQDYVYTGPDLADDDLGGAGDDDSGSSDISGGTVINQVLPPPENIYIIKQVIRHGAGGATVVDVTFGFDDVEGATSYQIRVTKE